MRDNQNRDLEAMKKWQEIEILHRQKTAADASRRHAEILRIVPYADWTEIENILCLRSGDSNFVAVPTNDAETPSQGDKSKIFDVVSLSPREFVVQLKKYEVRGWLWRRHLAEKGL